MPWEDPTGINPAQSGYLHSFRQMNFLVGGRGSGKTAVLVKKAEIIARSWPGVVVVVTEQTAKDINDILIPTWKDIAEPGLYAMRGSGGYTNVEYANGSVVRFRSRQAKRVNDEPPFHGPNVGAVFHDELSLDKKEDIISVSQMMLRQKSAPLILDATFTPRIGPMYRELLSLGLAQKIKTEADRIQIADDNQAAAFYGRTRENRHNMNLDGRMRVKLSDSDVESMLEGLWTHHEGKVWQFSEDQWPNGNMIPSPYNPAAPYLLGVDLGGANSAWQLYQLERHRNPKTGSREQLLVLKAEWTPHGKEPWLVLQEVKAFTSQGRYRAPMSIKIGADYRTPGTTGDTAEMMFSHAGWNSAVETITGFEASKDVQHQQAAMIMRNSVGRRKFCISDELESFHSGKTRGLLDVLRNDTWPDPGSKDYFRKEKGGGVYHEDSRDAFLYTCVGVYPPDYRPQERWAA